VSVRIEARPEAGSDGPRLTDEILGPIDDLMSQREARVDADRPAV
jgi:hypothetical protein